MQANVNLGSVGLPGGTQWKMRISLHRPRCQVIRCHVTRTLSVMKPGPAQSYIIYFINENLTVSHIYMKTICIVHSIVKPNM